MALQQIYLEVPDISWVLILCCTILLVSFVTAYLWFSYVPYQVLKRNGISGPSPSFFYGNYKELSKYGLLKYFEYLNKTYGQIVGYYVGRCPQILVTDLDLIKAITVKDFDYFMDRNNLPVDYFRALNIPTGLLFSRGANWQRARRILSPTFSASKMKMMEPLIVNSAKTLAKIFEGHADTEKSVEILRIFGAFTMESILSTAFGRVIDVQNGKSNVMTEAAVVVFSATQENRITSRENLTLLISNFPCLQPVLQRLIKYSEAMKGHRVLRDTADEIIRQRRIETSGKHRDLLQLMIDANIEDDSGAKKLTNEEIISQSVTFMLAGYETTSNTLTYTAYQLALHPDVQLKLQEEIDEYFKCNPTSSLYQASQDIKYMDMVVNESLRLYTTAPLFARTCTKDYQYGNIVIPKGVTLRIPAILLHKDPKYWENPEEFNVLRFTPEEKAKRPQMCFLPFGSGPRSCIGMRFAMMEAKIALIELMKKISFVRSADTEVPLKTTRGFTMSPTNGVYIKVALREV